MANQKLPIIDWTSGKIKELPSVEEKKAFEDYCKSKGIEELDIDEFYNTLKDFKNDDKLDHEVVNDFSIDAIKDNFTPPGAKKDTKVEDVDTSAIDEKDSGKSEEDDLDLYMKDLNDYMDKNKKGRDDIPVTTRR